MEERAQRIIESAIELAEKGGFEAVRLRDVAAHADVALGTLYRRFASKEDLLVAALERETAKLVRRVLRRPPTGERRLDRVVAFFAMATQGMCRRPNLTRACVKAAAAGEPGLAQRVGAFHHRMEALVVGALRGEFYDPDADASPPVTEEERRLATLLNRLWFACLVGWSGGQYDEGSVLEQMTEFGEVVFHGPRDDA